MPVSSFVARKSAGLVLIGLLGLAAGCQASDTLGGIGGIGGGQPAPREGQITEVELLGYCPSVTIRQGDAVLDSYQRGGQDDPSRLVYRATITDSSRSCTYQSGQTFMTIAVAGRIVPGPAGTVGNLRTPIRVSVYEDTQQIYSQVHNFEVSVTDTIGATQFIFTDTSFSMPNPTRRNIRVLIGYEKGAS